MRPGPGTSQQGSPDARRLETGSGDAASARFSAHFWWFVSTWWLARSTAHPRGLAPWLRPHCEWPSALRQDTRAIRQTAGCGGGLALWEGRKSLFFCSYTTGSTVACGSGTAEQQRVGKATRWILSASLSPGVPMASSEDIFSVPSQIGCGRGP